MSNKLKKAYSSPELRSKMSETTKSQWRKEEYRDKVITSQRLLHIKRPELAINRSKSGGFSSIDRDNNPGEIYWSTVLDELGISYTREKKFLTGTRRWYRMDFYLSEYNIDLEIDGKSHTIPGREERDALRDELISSSGITVIRVPWYGDIEKDALEVEKFKSIIEV